jgi:MFS family permease
MGMFLLGGVFAAQFGMSAIFGSKIGLSLAEISLFVSFFYIGALLLQYPIGWLSDRMDRRRLIMACAFAGGFGCVLPWIFSDNYVLLLIAAFIIGGMSNPLYSLLIAHTNDFVEYEDMAASSSGLLFINGLGAIAGPIVLGRMMDVLGAYGYFAILLFLFVFLGVYAAYRMTRRAVSGETIAYTAVMPTSSPVALEIAQEYAIDVANDDLQE